MSVAIVIFTAYMVLKPSEPVPEEELTLTVMSTDVVSTETVPVMPAITTSCSTTSEGTTAKITTSRRITTTAVITTISETETTTTTTTTTTESVTTSAVPPETTVTTTTTEPVTEEITEQIEEEIFIDINTADVDELTKLYGIGEVTAYEIVNYREQNGNFRNIEEIMNVYGIGEAKFSGIRDYIYVQNPEYPVEEYDEPEEYTESEPQPIEEPVTETIPALTLDDVAPIDINTAGIDELMLLPHVDEQVAREIIKLREELQKFTHVYELLYVEKLTQKDVAEIVEFVTVGQ